MNNQPVGYSDNKYRKDCKRAPYPLAFDNISFLSKVSVIIPSPVRTRLFGGHKTHNFNRPNTCLHIELVSLATVNQKPSGFCKVGNVVHEVLLRHFSLLCRRSSREYSPKGVQVIFQRFRVVMSHDWAQVNYHRNTQAEKQREM